jgi:squalene synthase HpnD
MTSAAVNGSAVRPPASSSFYAAMRILPRFRREAMYAVYAFCRAVDDVADGPASHSDRVSDLERWQLDVDALFSGHIPERLASLTIPVRTFGLRRQDFHAVIDGMMMDAAGELVAPDWATLDLYCDRVASAVGRLSVRIFGLDVDHGDMLAHHLGRALQLTNILRDLDEDAGLGRLYLPREALIDAGITEFVPDVVLCHPRLGRACAIVRERAVMHFREADLVMADCPRALVRAPRLMAAAYRTILDELAARGWSPPRAQVRLGRLRLMRAVFQYGLI